MRVKRNLSSYALITLLAFVLHAVMPFFALYDLSPTSVTQAEKNGFSFFGEKLFICTSDGFRWVDAKDLASGKAHPKPHSDYKCPLCYVAAQAGKTITTVSVLYTTVSTASHTVLFYPAVTYGSSVFLPGAQQPRAPPFPLSA